MKYLRIYSIPSFFLDIIYCHKKFCNELMVVSFVVNVKPEMVDVDEHGKDLTKNDSSSRDFVEDFKPLTLQSNFH